MNNFKIIFFENLNSTNEYLKELINKNNIEDNLVILAKTQKIGKGRLGRSWVSPKGGLWFSLLKEMFIDKEKNFLFSLLVPISIVKTLQKYFDCSPQIKWPNDIYLFKKKVCGILTETVKNYLVVGIGVNLNFEANKLPKELQNTAITALSCFGKEVNLNEFLHNCLMNINEIYTEILNNNYENLLAFWKANNITLNKWVKVTGVNFLVEGWAVDIDKSGFLLVKKQNGSIEKIIQGEVTLRD